MKLELQLERGESILAAWADGRLVWVLLESAVGKLRRDVLQPEEQSPLLLALRSASAALTEAMTAEVKRLVTEEAAR